MKESSPEKALFEVANTQQGFFTAKQAINCGYSFKNHHYYVKSDQWTKEGRGIYRLSNYPLSERPDLMLWYLWSRNRDDIPQGIFSHETSLSIYDLSDVMPAKLHMTVPKTFRKFGKLPEILKFHKQNLSEEDLDYFYGVKVTNPSRTIIDIIEEQTLSNDIIQQAISEALSRGLIASRRILLNHSYLQTHSEISTKLNWHLNQ